MATTVLERRPVAVTGGRDRTVRVWDPTTGRQAGPELAFPAYVTAMAVEPEGELVVGFGNEIAVLTHRLLGVRVVGELPRTPEPGGEA
ncbi:hypothetical protein ABZZ74_42605 [Streptomyces sp. NPDC006476]|uniref:hypothetical protein n=1 Tax=Streptomyces sp. NPDC006476 TaxID=3157175 RepID=UPI0033B72C0E